mmetsp:Transcript_3221/g.12732  ORF Transcript_3221/g.12732 Transcript_3221/m.12732 type:complete len:354 (-) Transcript_3221:650-1711(-)
MSTIARAVLAAPAGRLAARVGTRMTGSARAPMTTTPRAILARSAPRAHPAATASTGARHHRVRALPHSLALPSPSPTRPSSGVVRRASSIAANATADPASRQFPSTDVPSDAFYDAVVVVAGGMTDSGGLPAWVVSRLDHAVAEYRRHVTASDGPKKMYVVLSGSATPHKPPPLQKGGFTLHESTAMAEYVVANGVPPEAVLKDTASMDTIGNAYYSLLLHAAPRNWRKVQVVTSEFHIGRTRAAFEWVWGLWSPGLNGADDAEGRRLRGGTPYVRLDFCTTANDGLSREVVEARAEREARSEAALRDNATKVTTLADFGEWLYTTHLCYAVTRQHEIGEFAEMKTDPALKSY